MNIHFWKMHGAGNDFILVDDRGETFPASDSAWLERISARRNGVGCEGIILIQPSLASDFRMRFFNPDGKEAEMCGNGARCVARLAHDIGAAPKRMSMDTVAGKLEAEIIEDVVRLHMTQPTDWRLDAELDLDGQRVAYGFVNSGVPHVVVSVANLDEYDVPGIGRRIRYHADFAPAGTNANFIMATGASELRVRTYERGVEGETLACGTGVVASALIAGAMELVGPPVSVTAMSGDVLQVGYVGSGQDVHDVTLLGPAEYVYEGDVVY